MTSLDALLALAAAVAFGGFAPMVYVLARQFRQRRARIAATQRMQSARDVVASGAMSDLDATVKALSSFDQRTIDLTIEQLASGASLDDQRDFVGRLAIALGTLGRLAERALDMPGWNERAHAVRTLGQFGMAAALPALAQVLSDRNEDQTVRNLAAEAMAAIRDPEVIPLLVAELRRGDEQATSAVAEALIKFGRAASGALIALLDENEVAAARVWAARILTAVKDGDAVEPLIARLRDRHDRLRAHSAEALGAIADQRALLPLMHVALRDPAPLVRREAAVAAAQIAGAEASELLVAALSDTDYATRLRALEAFESMGLSDTGAIEQALSDPNHDVRKRAALALERLGYLDRLVSEGLASPERSARTAAYSALLALGRAGLVDGIAGRIRHESMQVRVAIARVCGELGTERAGPMLLGALDDPEWPVRASVCDALARLRPKGGGPALARLLSDREESVREAAASALAAYATAGTELTSADVLSAYEKGSVPIRLSMIAAAGQHSELGQILVDATRDPSEVVRAAAVQGLAARPVAGATPGLITALTDTSLEVRLAAASALGAAGTDEAFEALLASLPGAPPELRERVAQVLSGEGRRYVELRVETLTLSDSLDLRIGMAWTLGKIGDPKFVPVLGEFLRDERASLRASAAGALGKIPVDDAWRRLLAAADDRDPRTRAAVVNALGRSSGAPPGLYEALERRVHDPDAFVRNRAAIAIARAVRGAAAALAMSAETERLVDAPALTLMRGLCGTPETVALALRALGDSARLPAFQTFFDREEPAVCAAFLTSLKLGDGAGPGIRMRLHPEALAGRYEKLLRSSRDAAERLAAVEALAGMTATSSSAAFADALLADPEDAVRLRCAELLAKRVGDAVARSALLRAIADPNPEVAVKAVEGLRAERRDSEFAALLFRRLGTGSPAVNDATERTLAEMYRDDPIGFIDRAMGSEQPEAIVAALRALESLPYPKALPLYAELTKSRNADVRAAALRAAARSGAPDARELVLQLQADPDEAVRIASLDMIANEASGAVERLATARGDPAIAVRVRLCHLLGRFADKAALTLIERLTQDAAREVRAAALVSLLAYGDPETLGSFGAHWAGASPELRQQVRRDPRAPAVSHKLANLAAANGDAGAREIAVLALGALAATGHEELLLPLLRDPRWTIRIAAAKALAPSADPAVRRRIAELASDPEIQVRDAIRIAGFA
jgi:HEAT repeat protein